MEDTITDLLRVGIFFILYNFPQVDTLIQHQALLFMCAVPSFKMISLEQKALLVTDTTELLAIFRKVN